MTAFARDVTISSLCRSVAHFSRYAQFLLTAAALGTCLVMSGCATRGCDKEITVDMARLPWTSEDPWYQDVPPCLPYTWGKAWNAVNRDNVLSVVPEKAAYAVNLLEHQEWARLPDDECGAFSGRVSPGSGLHAYLVRAVYLNKGTGCYAVYVYDGYVHVSHGCLGRRALPMKREPLIVLLAADPVRVYSTCSMAE